MMTLRSCSGIGEEKKQERAMSEVVEEALLNLAIEEEFDNLIRELKKGVRAEVGRLRREDIYEV
ncbi:MAG TPA: hypothetical protein ENF96_01850 [Archaeoglobus veneficus]|nr:hypothetical protein [Archaeoglobus veneficus]